MSSTLAYGGLFSAAFLSATILPAQSELGLAALVISDNYSLAMLIFVASLGNSLGAVVNWGLGHWVRHFQDTKWALPSPNHMKRAASWYQRFGKWSLLLSWVPIIGDPLTLLAGFMRLSLLPFLLFVIIAKTMRYVIVVALVRGFFS